MRDTFGCHTRRDTVRLTFHNLTASIAPARADFCPGDTVTLRAQGSPNGRWRYAWTPTTGLSCATCSTTVARPTVTVTYAATLTDSASGCSFYRASTLTSYAYPDSFSAGPDVIARPTPGSGGMAAFTLQGRAPATAQFVAWTPAEPLDNPFSAFTNGRVDTTTVFVLSASNGPCATRDTAVVRYVGCGGTANGGAVMPNAFSPNGDGANEVFTLAASATATPGRLLIKTFRIYNRWGTLMHSEGGGGGGGIVMQGWDGRLGGTGQPVGAYVWHLSGECIDPATGERTPFEEEGTVTLVR